MRVAQFDALFVLGDFDDPLADRLGAAVRMLKSTRALEIGSRNGIGLDHAGPLDQLEAGEIGARLPHFLVGQNLGEADHRRRARAAARAAFEIRQLAGEIRRCRAGQSRILRMAVPVGQVAADAGADRGAVAVGDDRRHRRMLVREPIG